MASSPLICLRSRSTRASSAALVPPPLPSTGFNRKLSPSTQVTDAFLQLRQMGKAPSHCGAHVRMAYHYVVAREAYGRTYSNLSLLAASTCET